MSTLVAVAMCDKKTVYNTINGETFYKVPIKLQSGEALTMVISEYQCPTEKGLYTIYGCLCSDTIKTPKEHLFTYFKASSATKAEENDAPKNDVKVYGHVVKKGKLTMQKFGKQLLPVVVRCKMDDGHTSIIHAVLYDKDARQVDSVPDVRTVSINASGQVHERYNALEVHIDDVEIFQKGGN